MRRPSTHPSASHLPFTHPAIQSPGETHWLTVPLAAYSMLYLHHWQINQELKGKTMDQQPDQKKSNQEFATWIAVGIAVGAGIGVAVDNIAIGIAIGLAIGVAIGTARSKKPDA
ncbi:MAG: hypothetical protein JW862_10095 [Anaerolineales bacterium]|nr:hypothetical protein [Anaerolineales bacterium]